MEREQAEAGEGCQNPALLQEEDQTMDRRLLAQLAMDSFPASRVQWLVQSAKDFGTTGTYCSQSYSPNVSLDPTTILVARIVVLLMLMR